MESRLPGVYITKKKDNSIYYRSSITYRRKHISLGSFDSMNMAHLAYREALTVIEDSAISILDFNKHQLLSFEKWVILINFRDNNFYFSTPIYLRPKFFYYHLSPKIQLKFDIDDLFYFSSHKIMKRGSHLFVADYGMQVTIQNRYGIRNYAVRNRDYRFINDDCYDFRYENIEIINRYQGVTKETKNNVTQYRSKIHVNGNYTIGLYDSEIKAAIAYNKAIDLLKKMGITKNYIPNFIDGISNFEYADLYTQILVSKKLSSPKKLPLL